MNRSYGPWATLIDAGRNPGLSAFWRQRLTRLPGLSHDNPGLTRSAALALIVAAVAIGALPTLQGRVISAEPGSPVAAADGPAAIFRAGAVVDKLTGQPIAGATVTLRHRVFVSNEYRVLAELRFKTDAKGQYAFSIPPVQVAEGIPYIQLDVSHPHYAPRRGLSDVVEMILAKEKMGDQPFFERIELSPGESITGTIVTPDGQPAPGVTVAAFSAVDPQGESRAVEKTDERGTFRINLIKGADAVFWLLPQDYAPSTHVVLKKRGNLGRFVLQPGVRTTGRAVDEQGRPVAGVWVNAWITAGAARAECHLPVAEMVARAALTDPQGQFTLAPLPAGDYLCNVEEHARDDQVEERMPRPVPAVFVPQAFTLKPEETTAPVELRALRSAVVRGSSCDSHGKPRSVRPVLYGYLLPELYGHKPGTDGAFFHTSGQVDTGQFILRAPLGLLAHLDFFRDQRTAMRVRIRKDGPLSNQTRHIDLGPLTSNRGDILVVCYEAPVLLIKPVDSGGRLLKNVTLHFDYAPGRSPFSEKGGNLNGHDVAYHTQSDGRLRSEALLPDESCAVSVSAAGYVTKTETLRLPEGAVKELTVQLRKDASRETF